MNLITHDWNGSVIAQLSEATKIAKHDVPAGYVNATQMCKACNKQFNDYARLESTKEYWEGLSRFTGIPVDLLAMTNLKGRNDQRGTWVHPEIAIDLAQWVSVEFRLWANRTLKKVIQELNAQPTQAQNLLPSVEQPSVPELAESIRLISEIFDLTLGKTDIDPRLVAGAKLSAMAKRHPFIEQEAEFGKTFLSIPIEEELVRPTQLGEKLEAKTGQKWSAIRVNKLLVEQGFQILNPDKNPAYLPTEKGKPHSQLHRPARFQKRRTD